MVIEKLVDELEDLWLGFDLLCRCFGILCREGFSLAGLEANENLCCPFVRKLDQCDVLDDIG
ncbi:hypothetical protein P3T43_007235 [Paraburkholderia sp. GAS41]